MPLPLRQASDPVRIPASNRGPQETGAAQGFAEYGSGVTQRHAGSEDMIVRTKKRVKRPNGRGTRKQLPIVKPTRAISSKTSLFLHVRTGGRCEFDNCNTYLLEHEPTGTPGNYAERAHIWAFSERGPRGSGRRRPRDIRRI